VKPMFRLHLKEIALKMSKVIATHAHQMTFHKRVFHVQSAVFQNSPMLSPLAGVDLAQMAQVWSTQ
jgi:hypothetical protein